LIAETYSFGYASDDGDVFPLAFISLSNDAIKREDLPKQTLKAIPRSLRYGALPEVKIGRLGVRKEFQNMNVGTALVNWVKQLFTTDNRTGCRFLTVDAYNDDPTLNFYKKNAFDFYQDEDAEEDTRIMFFDLKTFVVHQGEG
jgi:GNAT superfamily N-acetyltransferase